MESNGLCNFNVLLLTFPHHGCAASDVLRKAFDLIELDGDDFRRGPHEDRKRP